MDAMSKESKGYKKMPKKIYIRTFGWPMDAFTRDDFKDAK